MNKHVQPARRAAVRPWFALTLAAALAACGGGGDGGGGPTATTITATNDTFTLRAGQTGALLANDTIGSAAANAASAGNALFTLTSGALPTGVTVSAAGVVAVAAGAVPATLSLAYRLCEATSTSNCANATAQVTIPTPPIVATADTFTLASGSSGDALANDTLDGAPATATLVTASATTALPTGVTFSAAGLLSVGSTATAGTTAITYRICQTVVASNCATATINLTVPATGTLSGRAIDAATAAGVSGVRVSVGGLTATTDATGNFSLPGLGVTARATVLFTVDTHAEAAAITAISGGTTDVQVRMVRVGATADVPVASGGTVTMAGSTAQVALPADGVQRADGSVPTGAMRVRITPIDPASDSSVMPGDFTTVVSGTASPIESFGALNVRLADSAGAALNLRSGQSATVRIPLASRDTNPPTSIPLFYFDTSTGRWVQEGTATLTGTGTARYYQGTVTHFSTWNADQISNTVRVTGCVADANGVRVSAATVSSDGINYSGTSTAFTDVNGNFSIAIRKSSQATLAARSGSLRSNTLSVGPYTVDSQLPNCLTLGQASGGITMKLTWGAAPSDLDSHLFTPSGAEVYYSSKGSLSAAPYAALDVDDTSSFGPEVVTINRLMVGTYRYFVVNYSGYGAGPIAASSARVELNIPGRAAELFTPPAGETSSTSTWTLFELDVDAQCNVTVRRVGTYANSEPVNPPTATPVYCVR